MDATGFRIDDHEIDRRPLQPRVRSIILIRWAAVVGQLTAILVVDQALGLALPMISLLVTVAAAAGVNFLLALRPALSSGPWRMTGWLVFDVVQIAVLLSLTGGLANPFTLWLLGPVTLAGASLRSRHVTVVAASAVLCVTIFTLWPLGPSPIGVRLDAPYQEFGLWFANVLAILFISAYLKQIGEDRERSAQALAAAEAALSREMRLSALGGLAAAAAHELGTPLATIQTSAKELLGPAGDDNATRREDAAMIVDQAKRCRAILNRLSTRGESEDAVHHAMPLRALLEEAADPFAKSGKRIDLYDGEASAGPAPLIARRSEILYGLKNLIENATQFAADAVIVRGDWNPQEVTIEVRDDGPGFPPDLLNRLGEPYVTRKGKRKNAGGLGLGVFIARTLIERSGGTVKFCNAPEGGARILIHWPRHVVETERSKSDYVPQA